ncbi:MarR family winged helix-turn-helix transcriptional regulator [Nocardia sp. NPDC049526]|uniref:MarR family winged helix-turn-helix transcriptional regulator n=1 Tax=Nocardia sp. NPDC049526 TaxID=3364316 RepID=UPI003797C5C5
MDPLFEFGLLTKAIGRELERGGNQTMQRFGLTNAQADALVVIGEAQPVSLKKLGGLLIAEGGHPSRLVDRLVESGLVVRGVAEDDRRVIQLSLTERGTELARSITEVRQRFLDATRRLLGDLDMEPGLALLRAVAQHTSYANLIEDRRAISHYSPRAQRDRQNAR